MILNGYKKSCFYFLTFYVRTIETAYLYLMMLGSKGILTPLIPNCCVLCTHAILKTFVIRSFFSKNGFLLMFWRVPSSKILLQASLHRISDLLTLVSYYDVGILLTNCLRYLEGLIPVTDLNTLLK